MNEKRNKYSKQLIYYVLRTIKKISCKKVKLKYIDFYTTKGIYSEIVQLYFLYLFY